MSTITLRPKLPLTMSRALRLTALTPVLALGGAWVDSMALRGNFRPVISSYHAICAQNRRDARCTRLIRFARPGAEVRLVRSR